MIAVDTNILVYAHRGDTDLHQPAYSVLNDALSGQETVAFCWPVVHEFLAIVTHPRIFSVPTPWEAGMEQVNAWLAAGPSHVIGETARHLAVLSGLGASGEVRGPVVHDARIAALCLEHGVRELWTADRDFGRFAALHVVNPLG